MRASTSSSSRPRSAPWRWRRAGALLPAAEDIAPALPALRLPSPRIALLGLVAFCSLFAEGAAADWSAVYLEDSLGATSAVAATGFAAYALAMAAGRLVGDRLALRWGPSGLLVRCGVLASAGLGVALLIGHPAAAVAGFALLGAGVAPVVPVVFRAGGSTPGVPSSQGIATVELAGLPRLPGRPAGHRAHRRGHRPAGRPRHRLRDDRRRGPARRHDPARPGDRPPRGGACGLSRSRCCATSTERSSTRGRRSTPPGARSPTLHGLRVPEVLARDLRRTEPRGRRDGRALARRRCRGRAGRGLAGRDRRRTRALPGAAELMAAWAGRVAIVTSGGRAPGARAPRGAGPAPSRPVLVSADDVEPRQARPRGLPARGGAAGVPPGRCLAIEDAPAGVAAARAAGARTVAVASTHDAADLRAPAPSASSPSLDELAAEPARAR